MIIWIEKITLRWNNIWKTQKSGYITRKKLSLEVVELIRQHHIASEINHFSPAISKNWQHDTKLVRWDRLETFLLLYKKQICILKYCLLRIIWKKMEMDRHHVELPLSVQTYKRTFTWLDLGTDKLVNEVIETYKLKSNMENESIKPINQ